MRSKLIVLLLFITVLTGCTRLENNIEFESELLSDQLLVDTLKESEALFAFHVIEENNLKTQEVFVWKNSLRTELRNDLLKILEKLDKDNGKIVKMSLDQFMKEDLNEQDSSYSSETSRRVIELLFPSEFNISSETLYQNLMHMVIRLETLPQYGDTEVISLKTITDTCLNSNDYENNVIHYVND
jgi:hypothetical protein